MKNEIENNKNRTIIDEAENSTHTILIALLSY